MTPSNTPAPPTPNLPSRLPILPIGKPVDLDIAVPGSKSMTNRAMILAALADGAVTLTDALAADDTFYMAEALKTLGFSIQAERASKTIKVEGLGGRIPKAEASLFIGNAGTAMRFLSAFVCLGHGTYLLDGNQRMRERPIKDLIESLNGLGIDAHCVNNNGCPPVRLVTSGLPGGRIRVEGSRSSQYISAVLQTAPYANSALEIEVVGEFVSRPYVELTLRMMSDFGIGTRTEGERIYIPTHGAKYRAGTYRIEGDATASSYFLAAAAILGGRVAVTNVKADSAQGDSAFAKILGRMGCRVRMGFLANNYGLEVSRDPKDPLLPIEYDLNDMPDLAQTLAAVAMFADGPSHIFNIANLRIKETDRLAAVSNELRKLGAAVEEGPDYLEIVPGPRREAMIETYDDHRMAMAMALIGLGRPGVTIENPSCVAKTYPHYFEDLERLRR